MYICMCYFTSHEYCTYIYVSYTLLESIITLIMLIVQSCLQRHDMQFVYGYNTSTVSYYVQKWRCAIFKMLILVQTFIKVIYPWCLFNVYQSQYSLHMSICLWYNINCLSCWCVLLYINSFRSKIGSKGYTRRNLTTHVALYVGISAWSLVFTGRRLSNLWRSWSAIFH